MIKTYISALLVILVASAQTVHAQQSMDEVFAQMDSADAAGQTGEGAASSDEVESAGQEAGMFDSLYEEGVARYQEGLYDEALSIFDAVLAIDKYHAGAINYKKRTAGKISAKAGKKQIGRASCRERV